MKPNRLRNRLALIVGVSVMGLFGVTVYAAGPMALAPPATDPGWTFTGSLNARRNNHTATVLPNGKVLVAGGNAGASTQAILNSVELYDPATGTWSLTGTLNVPRYHSTATLLPNGKIPSQEEYLTLRP